MALKSGFYNAKYDSSTDSYDRVYDANDMSIIASMLVNDGIFVADANHFQVTPGSSQREILISPGKAFFRNKWIYNDETFSMILPSYVGMSSTEKWDAIIIDLNVDEADTSAGARSATFKVVTSPDSDNPVRPVHSADYPNGGTHMVNNRQVTFLAYNGSTHFQYPLAYVRRRASQTTISSADIYIVVGLSEYKVPGVSYAVDPGSKIDGLYKNWVADWNAWLAARLKEWDNSETPIGFLQNRSADWVTFLNQKTAAWTTWFGSNSSSGVQKDWADMQADYLLFKSDIENWRDAIEAALPSGGIAEMAGNIANLELKIGDRNDGIIILDSRNYGTELPNTNKVLGRLFFLKV